MSDAKLTESDKNRIADRRNLMMQLRVAGITSERKLAAAMTQKGFPCSHITIHNDLKAVNALLVAETTENVKTWRALFAKQNMDCISALWPKASAGNERAIETLLHIQERISRNLGLDAPTLMETTNTDNVVTTALTLAEIDARLRDIAAGDDGISVATEETSEGDV